MSDIVPFPAPCARCGLPCRRDEDVMDVRAPGQSWRKAHVRCVFPRLGPPRSGLADPICP
jgi:hypothetical protein